MNVLAINTSDDLLSVALNLAGKTCHEQQLVERNHNQSVLILIDRLMRNAGLAFTELDGIAFGQGPGSFTGLRIAAAVVQGIAFGAQLPVVPISCLAAIAQRQAHEKVIVAVKAKRAKIYWGQYIRDEFGLMKLDGAEHVGGFNELMIQCEHWHGAGSGWDHYGSEILTANSQLSINWTPGQTPHAVEIAVLGAAKLDAGLGQDPCMAIPDYHSPYFTS